VSGTEKSSAWSVAAINSRRLSYDMKNILLKQRVINFTIVALLGLVSAGAAAATPSAENLLLSAGFKAKAATTAKQRQELKTLPEGTVSPVMQRGMTFYIYPDPVRDEIYVGSKAQYQAYENLMAQQSESAGPIKVKDSVRGFQVPVREFYGWEPFDSLTR
jgi:hypothetical protein